MVESNNPNDANEVKPQEQGDAGAANAQDAEATGVAKTKEEVEEEQRKIEEERKLIEMSNAYEEQLKKEIAESSPYISELMDLSVLK